MVARFGLDPPAHAARRAGRAVQWWRRVPMSARAPRPSLGATGDSRPGTRLRPRSQPARSSRQAGSSAPATRQLPGCSALVQRSAWCTESLIHACPARLPSGTDSWLGTGMGVGQRAGRSGGADPANWLRSHRRLGCAARSRPIPVRICAPLGHDPLGTPQGPSGCGRERSRALTGRREPKSLTTWAWPPVTY